MRDDDFWQQYRQVELTESENSIDNLIKHIEQLKGFKYIIFGLKALIENFVETGSKETSMTSGDFGPAVRPPPTSIPTSSSRDMWPGVWSRSKTTMTRR